MELHPEFEFLPKSDHRVDLNQFHEPTPPALRARTRKELMALAQQFQSMEPWLEISENELFGIRDAETNALHLISVLGGDGDLFSLHCHMPPEGITFWQNALMGQECDPAPGLTELRLLECDFMNPVEAAPEDLASFKKHGKKVKGSQLLPCFRSYQPGYFPWFLEQHEAEQLISVFKLFFRFQEEILPQRDSFYQWENPFGEMPGIPVFYIEKDHDPANLEEWQVRMEVLPAECLAPLKSRPDVDPDMAELKVYPRVEETWEIASFYMPCPIFQGDRPYYPKTAIGLRAIEGGSRCPCDPIIYGGDGEECDTDVIRQAFKDLVEYCQFMPEMIRVDSKASFAALESYADEYDFDLQLDSQELMPHLVGEIVHSLEVSESDWETELLDAVVDAIPSEFQCEAGSDNLDESVAKISDHLLDSDMGFDSEELRKSAHPGNIIFADFHAKKAAGSE